MHRVFCSDIPEAGGYAVLESREAEHLFKVFRARAGESVELLDGHGVKAQGVIEEGKMLKVLKRETVPEPEEKLHLCCALPRKQKLDQLLKQATELGAWSIRPVRCMRSVAEGGPRERWDLLLREACKQSGNPFLPVIEPEAKLPDALEKLQQENIKIYYGSVAPAAHGEGFAHAKAVVIGPEGGFAPEELQMMEKMNAEPLNLGPHVLRLETAAVCALAVLRRMSIALLLGAMVFFTGCSCDSDANPMLTKGQALLENGDTAGAHDYFLKAIAHDPEDPNAYLALARLCEEQLDEPLEAIYAYTMYLKVLPEGAEGRAEAEAALENLKTRAVRQFGGSTAAGGASDAEVRALREENQALRQTVSSLRTQVQNLNNRANALTRQLQSRSRR